LIFARLGQLRWSLAAVSALVILTLAYGAWIGLDPLLARAQARDEGRLTQWLTTIPMVKDFPLLGVGLGAYKDIYPRYQPLALDPANYYYPYAHNDLLQIVVELGPIGGLLVAYAMWRVARDLLGAHLFGEGRCPVAVGSGRHVRRRDPYSVSIAVGAIAAVLALLVWVYGWMREEQWFKSAGLVLGWTLISWTALRWPNGAMAFVAVIGAFLLLHVVMPALRHLWQLPRNPKPTPPKTENGTAPAVAALVIGSLVWFSLGSAALARSADFQSAVSQVAHLPGAEDSTTYSRLQIGGTADYKSALRSKEPTLAESVKQNIRIEEKFVLAVANFHWQAAKGQMLPLLFEPAVLTRVTFPTNALKLVQVPIGSKRAQQLLAQESGVFDVEVQYQLQVTNLEAESGFALPTPYGLINELHITLANLDVDVLSPQAVSIQRAAAGSNTVATLVLAPVNNAWIAWRPRTRDVKREKPVFYAELQQLYVPSAGVIEGAHYVAIRPAQGELSELVFDVPSGATITDVNRVDPATSQPLPATSSIVSLWRFDPDTRKLRVNLNPAQSQPFTLMMRSQVSPGPLPFEQVVGLVSVENAAGEMGLLGVATGHEVQLDTVSTDTLSAINLEDFPSAAFPTLQARIPGFAVRRAFRYADVKANASLKASAVEPDVRVETQDTLSLSEDRIVLASNATVDITRAGIFRLSFVLPAGLDVESISGPALSHWTELKADVGRVITLNLRGKTEGQQQFAFSLAGPGVKATNAWTIPQLVLREASKQRGTLLIAPEQGMRLEVGARAGVTQLDPQKSGIRQKGVLAFRVLQTAWSLKLDIEQVDPWIQVTSLQHATVNEAQVKVAANLQYQIENTGLKAFRLFMPANAESVSFHGEQVSDFRPLAGTMTNGLQQWEVKLHRRVIGPYLLQVSYQTPVPEQAAETTLRGVQAADVNLQRGFVTVQSGGRLQLRVDATPAALQPAEWRGDRWRAPGNEAMPRPRTPTWSASF
jgi:hypothetical protein